MIFGGKDATGQSSAKVFSMDPMTLAVRELAAVEPSPMGVERSEAGVYLDRRNRNFIVYGGKRGGEWLGDGWSFDLTFRKWTLLTGATTAPQPVEESRPYVYYDVSDPENPAWINQMWPGGRIKSVSIHRGLLAAGRSNGKVYIYDMRNGGQEQVGEVDAGWKIGKVEFREGKLWVLKKNGKRVPYLSKTLRESGKKPAR